MALKIALVAKNPFALERARGEFLAAHKNEAHPWGHGCLCEIVMDDDSVVRLLSESDWRRGSYCREQFDQFFRVGPEPLGIDFMLELNECLKGSCVPEEWQWQKWMSPEEQPKAKHIPGVKVFDVSLVPDGGYPINAEDGWKPVHILRQEE